MAAKKPPKNMGVHQVNRTGAGPMKDSRTKRNRSRGDNKRNAINDSKGPK